MFQQNRDNDSVHWYINELTSRIIAESQIPTDRFHLGKMIMQSFKDDPGFIIKIDGATNESETQKSALERTIRCAIAIKNFGLQKNDVIVLMAPNHIDLTIPFYAALYLGVVIAPVDQTLGFQELKGTFSVNKAKMVFCQSERVTEIQLVLDDLKMDAEIVTFDKGDYVCSFSEFLERYGDDTPSKDFKPTDFDAEDSIAFLISTSGTTGLPKAAVITHKNIAITTPYIWSRYFNFPTPTRLVLMSSPIQWLTAIINYVLSPILKYPLLVTSQRLTLGHTYDLINTYKPTYTVFNPTFMTTLVQPGSREKCDFTCFDTIVLGGSAVPQELINEMKVISPNTEVLNTYGMSEFSSIGFHADPSTPGSCGKPMGCFQYRLVDVETELDIHEANVPGELWVKGPGIFKEYYNNSQATEETFAEDRWFKTGDMFYRNENWNYFFLERFKLLLKYGGYQISPVELESVIRHHPSVLDVAVTGVPDKEYGDLPVACVVPKSGHSLTAQNVKDLVKESLSDAKELRGGVIFLNEIPMTASAKVDRRRINQMVLKMERE